MPPKVQSPLERIRHGSGDRQEKPGAKGSYFTWAFIVLLLAVGIIFLYPLLLKWDHSMGLRRGPEQANYGTVVGIDIGSVNSRVAIKRNGTVEIIPDSQGNKFTPSWVSFDGRDVLVGERARTANYSNSQNTVYNINHLIGHRNLSDADLQMTLHPLPLAVKAKNDGTPKVVVKYHGKTKEFTPEEIMAKLLLKLKADAEAYLGEPVTHAVMSVPSYFNDNQRTAIREAGKLAGLQILRVVNEPTMASIGYELDNQSGEAVFLVYDLGGTFDVSVLSLDDGVYEILATAGDLHLGSREIHHRLLAHVLHEYSKQTGGVVDVTDPVQLRDLERAVEEAVIVLSTETSATIKVEGFSETLTRAKFEELTLDLFESTMHHVGQVLKDANVTVTEVDKIILVGGSARIPRVHQLLTKYFGKEPSTFEGVQPDEAVVHGAATQGAILSGEEISDLGCVLQLIPLTLGIETAEGSYVPIITRNSVVPIRRPRNFTTSADNQAGVTIKVYEGEMGQAKENHLLGRFDLAGINPASKGVPQIEVTFEIDANFKLTVRAEEKSSNISNLLILDGYDDVTRLSVDDIEGMILRNERAMAEDKPYGEHLKAFRDLAQLIYGVKTSLPSAQLPVDGRMKIERWAGQESEWLESQGKTASAGELEGKFNGLMDSIQSVSREFLEVAFRVHPPPEPLGWDPICRS